MSDENIWEIVFIESLVIYCFQLYLKCLIHKLLTLQQYMTVFFFFYIFQSFFMPHSNIILLKTMKTIITLF